MDDHRHAGARPRRCRGAGAALTIVAIALAACTSTPGGQSGEPSPAAGAEAPAPPIGEPTRPSRCPHVDPADGTITLFRTRAGTCIDPGRVIAYRCGHRLDPVLVLDARGTEPRTFVGERFAVAVRETPDDARRIATARAAVVWATEGDGAPIYVEEDGTTRRWLELPDPGSVADPPEAYLLGDSILDGARFELEAELANPESPDPLEDGEGWNLTIDAEIGRAAIEGVSPAAAAALATPTIAVVELGTNDADPRLFTDGARSIVDSFADAPLLVWVTVRSPQEVAGDINASIRRLVAVTPNAALADWRHAVPDDALQTDGVHLLPERVDEFSDFLAGYLRAWHDAAVGRGATACGPQIAEAVDPA